MTKTYFYYSAMNAGKSTTLLQANYNYRERNTKTLLFTPSFDYRFDHPAIYSRIGLHHEAILFDQHFDILSLVTQKKIGSIICVVF